MPTEVRVRIKCGEQECGGCRWRSLSQYCFLFRRKGDHTMPLEMKAGRPQRCAACKNAEVKDNARRHLDQ